MKGRLGSAILLSVTIVLSLAMAEAGLRMIGHRPFAITAPANEQVIHAPDPVLGWRNREGRYVIPPYHPDDGNITYTFLEDGRRATAPPRNGDPGAGDSLVVVGGSFAQGFAISDEETLAWKLQQRFPRLNVLNYGTGGYGTYQSLLTLERVLPTLKSPRFVVYGFIDDHDLRNVADESWLYNLARMSSRGHVDTPYVSLARDGSLVRHRPERYPIWPLIQVSVLMDAAERAYMKLATRGRYKARREATESLLLEMDRLARRHGASLLVVFLFGEEETMNRYGAFLDKHGIDVADCNFPAAPELSVRGEGHPNGKLNTLWAECIAADLRGFPGLAVVP